MKKLILTLAAVAVLSAASFTASASNFIINAITQTCVMSSNTGTTGVIKSIPCTVITQGGTYSSTDDVHATFSSNWEMNDLNGGSGSTLYNFPSGRGIMESNTTDYPQSTHPMMGGHCTLIYMEVDGSIATSDPTYIWNVTAESGDVNCHFN